MPRDIETLRRNQREWMARRRKEWFALHGPCVNCKSWDNLELDHIDPSTKVTHKVWSWAQKRRDTELAKCQVLCYDCHLGKTLASKVIDLPPHGDLRRYNSKSMPCRCHACRAANAAYRKELRSRI